MLDLGFRSLEIEQKFREYLTGKSVVIVSKLASNKDYAPGIEWGKLIDSYDVVVRLHVPHIEHFPHCCLKGEFVWSEYHEQVGKRCDIFYNSFILQPEDQVKLPFFRLARMMIESFKSNEGKFLCTESPIASAKEVGVFARLHDLMWMRTFSPDDYRVMFRLWDYREPLQGTRAIVDILTKPVKSAMLIGFPCYMKKESKVLDIDSNFEECGSGDQRNPKRDFDFIRQMYEERDNLDVDPVMRELFERVP